MTEKLLSVGLDVGTTTTQLVVSQITAENRASGFCVPQMDITEREILYESPVHFTPLVGDNLVNGQKIAEMVEEEYKKAGIKPEQVDTGAVIITGETSRKENAAAVLGSLSALAGDFVVATAGPDLESVLAAKGAGAVAYSEKTGKRVLHMDIGGGTANLALIEEGQVVRTGCLNVGGRLVKLQENRISYISPVLQPLWNGAVGDLADKERLEAAAVLLAQGLEMAAGLREPGPLLEDLRTKECAGSWIPPGPCVLSFSGGVADCIEDQLDPFAFGDLGVLLGRAIKNSRLCRGEYILGQQTIRATVIGAGCHSAQLSGSTVFCKNAALPMKNLPVAAVSEREQLCPEVIAQRLAQTDSQRAVLAIPGFENTGYDRIKQLADAVIQGFGGREILVCARQDLAKALGQRISLLLGSDTPCLCIDRVGLQRGDYLDVGKPVGPCLPVVVKTLVLSR